MGDENQEQPAAAAAEEKLTQELLASYLKLAAVPKEQQVLLDSPKFTGALGGLSGPFTRGQTYTDDEAVQIMLEWEKTHPGYLERLDRDDRRSEERYEQIQARRRAEGLPPMAPMKPIIHPWRRRPSQGENPPAPTD